MRGLPKGQWAVNGTHGLEYRLTAEPVLLTALLAAYFLRISESQTPSTFKSGQPDEFYPAYPAHTYVAGLSSRGTTHVQYPLMFLGRQSHDR